MAPLHAAEPSGLLPTPMWKRVTPSLLQAQHAPPCEHGGKFARTVSGASTHVPDDAGAEDLEHKSPGGSSGAEGVLCFGLPRLQSPLGRWADAVVHAEDWLEDARRKQQQASCSKVRREYLVDNSDLRTETCGLAYRCSKNLWDRDHDISGPMWGDTVRGSDQGDGWVKVGEHFLPMELDGTTVLTQRTEPLQDGPSLTADGVALDLEFGRSIMFSHDKELAEISEIKRQFKEDRRMLRAKHAVRMAREAEARVLAGMACSVDPSGVVRGFKPPAREEGKERSTAQRLRAFHRQRAARRRAGDVCGADEGSTLCAGPDGKVFLLLHLEKTAADRVRLLHKRALLSCPKAVPEEDGASSPVAVDLCGVIHP